MDLTYPTSIISSVSGFRKKPIKYYIRKKGYEEKFMVWHYTIQEEYKLY